MCASPRERDCLYIDVEETEKPQQIRSGSVLGLWHNKEKQNMITAGPILEETFCRRSKMPKCDMQNWPGSAYAS